MSGAKPKPPAPRSKAKKSRTGGGPPGSRRTSAVTGAASGGSLAVAAQHLPEPWRYILSVTAPIVATVIASIGPKVLAWLSREFGLFLERRDAKSAIGRLEATGHKLRLRLAKMDPTDPKRAELQTMIDNIEDSITRQQYQVIVGDLVEEGPVQVDRKADDPGQSKPIDRAESDVR